MSTVGMEAMRTVRNTVLIRIRMDFLMNGQYDFGVKTAVNLSEAGPRRSASLFRPLAVVNNLHVHGSIGSILDNNCNVARAEKGQMWSWLRQRDQGINPSVSLNQPDSPDFIVFSQRF